MKCFSCSSFGVFAAVAQIASALFVCSCSHGGGNADAFVRLDKTVFEGDGIAQEDEQAVGVYLQLMGRGGHSLGEMIDSVNHVPAFRLFYDDTDSLFRSDNEVSKSLETMEKSISGKLPVDGDLRFYGVISPYRQQIMLADSLVFIALNHYLGPEYPGYEGLPAYMRELKKPERIPYDVAEAVVASRYPYVVSSGSSLVNRLLYEGALAKAVISVVPDADISRYLGLGDEDVARMEADEGSIWNEMVVSDMLYSKDPVMAEKLFAPSPGVKMKCGTYKGRLGRFIGYRILQSYLGKAGKVPLDSLLSPGFYGDIRSFLCSGYNPL